jgi:hypothetical protein
LPISHINSICKPLVGYQNQPVVNEVEPNGGGDCNQTNNTLPLGVDLIGYIDASGCTVDEFKVHLNVGDFNAAGDYLEIYMTNPNGDYSDHRFMVFGMQVQVPMS